MTSPAREHVIDAVKATPVVGFLGWLVSGHTLTYLSTAIGLIYMTLITHQKAREMGVYRWIARRLGLGPKAPPAPPVRTPQDE